MGAHDHDIAILHQDTAFMMHLFESLPSKTAIVNPSRVASGRGIIVA
jgi:hypothetical protein